MKPSECKSSVLHANSSCVITLTTSAHKQYYELSKAIQKALWLLLETGAPVGLTLFIFITIANAAVSLLQKLYLRAFSEILRLSPCVLSHCCSDVGKMTLVKRHEATQDSDFFQLPAARERRFGSDRARV